MVARQAHILKVVGSNPSSATITPGNAKWNTLRTVVVTIEYYKKAYSKSIISSIKLLI